ncbi:MAG TPA: hypothetical protein VNL77_22400 [Roseiflexaceae bacterium]|nr:hypothetical protein [Roseiflexaceae bacterium]
MPAGTHGRYRPQPRRVKPRLQPWSSVCPRSATLDQGDVAAYKLALEAAANLKKFFPDWFAQHVAHRHVDSYRALLGVVRAWLCRAGELIDIDTGYGWLEDILPYGEPRDSVKLLTPKEREEHCHGIITEYAANGVNVYDLWPCVYGFPGETSELFEDDNNALALALWTMSQGTRWGLAYHNPDDLWRRYFDDPVLLEVSHTLPRFQTDARLGVLVAAVAGDTTFEGADLGLALRYVWNIGGNQFMEINYEMVAEMADSGLDWDLPIETIQEIAADQLLAEQCFDAYHALNRAVHDDKTLLGRIITYINDRYQALPADAPDPFAGEDTSSTPHMLDLGGECDDDEG